MASQDPLVQWKNTLMMSRSLMQKECKYDDVYKVLQQSLDRWGSMSESDTKNQLLCFTIGWIGECLFFSGKVGFAVSPYEKALDLCRKRDDLEGIIQNLGNLHEVHRYLCHPEEAAKYALELADAFDRKAKEAKWKACVQSSIFRQRARMVKKGEPLCRVVVESGGEAFEVDEIPKTLKDKRLGFTFARNRVTLRPAVFFTEQGRKLGQEGKYSEAVEMFSKAAGFDEKSPDALYEKALTLLRLRKYDEAIDCFRKVDELAPGWYYCRADLLTAQKLSSGALTHQDFEMILELEKSPDEGMGKKEPEAEEDVEAKKKAFFELVEARKKKLAECETLVRKHPHVALFRIYHGDFLLMNGRMGAGQASYSQGIADAEDDDVKTRLLVRLARSITGPGAPGPAGADAKAAQGDFIGDDVTALVTRLQSLGVASKEGALVLPSKRDLLVLAKELNGNLTAAAMAHVMLTMENAVR